LPYVLDASVILKWFVPEVDSGAALRLLDAVQAGELVVIAPDILLPELGNALWKLSVIRKHIPASIASRDLADFLELPVVMHSSKSVATIAFDIALTAKHSFYDSLYVATAIDTKSEMITADGSLVRKLQGHYPFIRHLGSL
jgi:predicted nucleic acid-binding protein